MVNETIRHFTYYVKRMFKFYDLKAQVVPQVLFVMLLLVSFGFRLAAQPALINMSIYQQQFVITYIEELNPNAASNPTQFYDLTFQMINSETYLKLVAEFLKVSGMLLLQQALLHFLLFFYLGAYLTDLETKNPSAAQYFSKFFQAFPRYAGFNVLYYILLFILFMILCVFLSFVLMFLPIASVMLPVAWFLTQVFFIFKDVPLLDTRVGVFKNFRLAWKLSSGNRIMIGVNTFFIESMAMMLFLLPIVSILQESRKITPTLFIVSFLEVIVLLIRQRLITLMYFDRTRIAREEEPGED
jgi:hypothetical protein